MSEQHCDFLDNLIDRDLIRSITHLRDKFPDLPEIEINNIMLEYTGFGHLIKE